MDNYIQRIGLLFLRIFVGGTMLLAHGVPKLLDPKPFIEALSSNGFPLPNIMAYLSISAEAIFPVFIILGVFTRVSALIIAINMFVAAFVFHLNIKGDPFENFDMNKKELILNEIEKVTEPLLEEILDFVSFLKTKATVERMEAAVASESSLNKDWLKPEEREAWRDL